MANIKISQLPILLNANVHSGDSIPIVDSAAGETKQITIGQLDNRYTGVPDGGTTSQLLAKASGTNKDVYWKTISKSDVGLGNVDNTSDANKPISNATNAALSTKANTSALATKADISYVNTQLGNKQDALPAGSNGEVLTMVSGSPAWAPSGGGPGAVTSVFGRNGNVTAQIGDYDKTMIGLPNVDDTSDLDKPISNLTQIALNGKQGNLPGGTNGQLLTLVGGSPIWADAPVSLPSQATHAGKFLQTNGTVASWQAVPSPAMVVSTTQTLAASGTVARVGGRSERVKVQGTSGETSVSISASPAPQDGDQLFIQGMSDSNPIIVGPFYLTAGLIGHLMWDAGSTSWLKVGGV